MTFKMKLKDRTKIVQAKEKLLMTKENGVKGTTSIKILLDSNYWETMVRNETGEEGKGPCHERPWISQFKEFTVEHTEERETLRAFNLRNNMAKLVFNPTISGPV